MDHKFLNWMLISITYFELEWPNGNEAWNNCFFLSFHTLCRNGSYETKVPDVDLKKKRVGLGLDKKYEQRKQRKGNLVILP